jgi:integral membrane protein
MPQTPIAQLRLIAILEGISFLILLGVAMPMKYLLGIEAAVKVVGWTHGILFMLFCAALVLAMRAARWTPLQTGIVFAAALVPFGPFLIDGRLRRADAQHLRDTTP